MIEIANLVKKYDTFYAVSDVSFSVRKGEIVGFLGPNGAGKTTTMRILTGYLPPDSGNVTVNDISIYDDALAVKQAIGYLPESAPLYGDMMVDEYLSFIARARGIQSDQVDATIRQAARKTGIESVFKKNIDELSKGFRQRVGLAQALLHDPEVLVLDEPTSGLDPIQIQEIRRLIREIGKEKTIILSTHIMQEVEAVCDRVLIINKGKIIAEGTPAELRARSQGHNSLTITVHGNKEKVRQLLPSLPGFLEFHELREGEDFLQMVVTSQDRIAKQVFQWAVDNQFSLSELNERTVSLEDMFLELTHEETEASR